MTEMPFCKPPLLRTKRYGNGTMSSLDIDWLWANRDRESIRNAAIGYFFGCQIPKEMVYVNYKTIREILLARKAIRAIKRKYHLRDTNGTQSFRA